MSTETSPAVQPPRLNPFIFPSDTDFRFVLLIATVVGVSMFYYQLLFVGIPFINQRWSNTQDSCMNEVYGQSVEDFRDPSDLSLVSRYLECMRPVQEEKAAWIVGGVMLLLATATILYWIFPLWKTRRDHLTLLSAEDAPEVVAYLAELCREVKLPRPPTFLWNPLNPSSSGLAFGRLGRYYVALTGGLVTRFYTDLPAFRAVLLHELAHLKNADVDKTYFTVAIWQAFLLVVLLPYVAVVIFGNLGLSFSTIWSVAVLAALVYLIRNSVLRARELYADVRAAVWDGSHGALGRVLASLPNQKGRRWRFIFQVHPSPSERRRTLANTDSLFQLNFWIAVGTGIAVAIARSGVELSLDLVSQSLELTGILSALIFAPLVVGIVGLGVWRAAFASGAYSKASVGTGRLALGVGLGMMVGRPLYFDFGGASLVDPFSRPLPSMSLIYSVLFELVWIGMLVAVLFFLLTWIAAGASIWLEVAAASRSPRPIYTLCLTLASGLFAVGFGWLLVSHRIFEISSISSIELILISAALPFYFLIVSLSYPFAFLVFSILWTFPLLAWFWRRRAVATATARWAFLDPLSTQLLTRPLLLPLQPKAVVVMGMVTGLLFCGMLLVIRVLMRLSGLSDVISSNDQYKLDYFIGQVALAVLMQVGVAVITAGWVKRLGWAHGLLAAFVAGCLMTVGLLGLNLLFGGTIESCFAWITFSQIVNWGALLSLLPAVGASAIAGWMRQPRLSYAYGIG